MPRRAARLACLFAPVLCALSLASCSDDKDPLDTATTAGTTGDATAATSPTTGDATTTADPTTGTTGGADDPVWMTPYCYPVSDKKWLAAWIEREQQVLQLVNQARAAGADCGTEGKFGPAAPLTIEPHLHCAARAHAMDMAERDFFDHVNPDGEDPFARMEKAGYTDWMAAAENIAAGSDDAEQTVLGWLDSDGHCANMLDPKYKDFGVGFYEGAGQYNFYWTQTFGAPFQ